MKHGLLKSSSAPTSNILDSDIACAFVAPISVLSNQPAYSQDAMNLRRSASSQGVQRWEITTNLYPSNNSAELLLHTTLNGTYQKFYATMPQVHGLVISSASLYTSAPSAAGASTISVTGLMTPGEFINFGIDPKVYLVTAATSNSVTILPALLSAVPDVTNIRRGRNTYIRLRYDTDTQIGIIYTDGILSDHGSVKLIEAL